MECKPDILGWNGLQFFGAISASISHEIKNVIAIINENAGLLEDYCFMAEKGKPIDPARMKAISEKVAKQVKRGDGIIRMMNRFAHSVDEPVRSVDLAELIALVVALNGRFAANKNVKVDVRPAEAPLLLSTNPFYLENLLFLCLQYAMESAGGGGVLTLTPEKSAEGFSITITGLADFPEPFPTRPVEALLEALDATLTADPASKSLTLALKR